MGVRLLFLFLIPLAAFTQEGNIRTVVLKCDANVDVRYDDRFSFKDRYGLQRKLNRLRNRFIAAGYVNMSFDSLGVSNDTLIINMVNLNRYKWSVVNLKQDSTAVWLNNAGLNFKLQSNQPVSLPRITWLSEDFLSWAENNGYPFASCGFSELKINGDSVNGVFEANVNRYVLIDSIINKGNAKIKTSVFHAALGIKPGKKYQHQKIQSIERRLRSLGFIKQRNPYALVITESDCKLLFDLVSQKNNSADGFLGLQPKNSGTGYNLVGQIRVRFRNAFSYAEAFDLEYRGLQDRSRDLKVNFLLPYLAASPLGFDYVLRVFQRDTTFTEFTQEPGARIDLGKLNALKVFYKQKSSSIIKTEANSGLASTRYSGYGFSYIQDQTNNPILPTKGFKFSITAGAGSRTARDTAEIKTPGNLLYNGECIGHAFIPFSRWFYLATGFRSAFLGGQKVFINESLRLGGFQSLRGFDEESLQASVYTLAYVEPRWSFEEASYLFIFANMAWYELNARDLYVRDTPYGFGAGITFSTKAGLFSLSWAPGVQKGNPIDVRAARIHAGIISIF